MPVKTMYKMTKAKTILTSAQSFESLTMLINIRKSLCFHCTSQIYFQQVHLAN